MVALRVGAVAGWQKYFILYISRATDVVNPLLSSSAQETVTLPEPSVRTDDADGSQSARIVKKPMKSARFTSGKAIHEGVDQQTY